MGFLSGFRNAVNMLFLNKKAIKNSSKSIWSGFLIAAVASIIAGLGKLIFTHERPVIFIITVVSIFLGCVIVSFITSFFLWLISKIFKSKGSLKKLYSCLLHTTIITVFLFIPSVGSMLFFLAKLWLVVVYIFILIEVYKMKPAEATLTVVLLFLILMLIFVALIVLLFISVYTLSIASGLAV